LHFPPFSLPLFRPKWHRLKSHPLTTFFSLLR
jgi:hypothetical protein